MLDIKHYINEIGLDLIVDCGIDLTAATATKLKVRKPGGGVEVIWDAAKHTIDSLNNYLIYTTAAGDLNEVGTYRIQAYVEMPGYSGLGETADLVIFERFR